MSWAFSSKDLALSIEEYSERYIRPAAAVLANQVDADLCALYDAIYNEVWQSSFATPSLFMTIGSAMQKLDEEAAPPEERVVVLNPAAHWGMANALTALYAQEPATTAFRKGYLGKIGGAQFYMDQNINVHTAGAHIDTASIVTSNTQNIHWALTGATGNVGVTATAAICTSAKSAILIDYIGGGTAAKTEAFLPGDCFSVNNVYANDYINAWFIGGTPNLVTGVYVGFDDRRSLGESETGARAALPIWIAFMKEALKQLPVVPFEIPDGVSFVKVDSSTGLLESEQEGEGQTGVVELFTKGSEPTHAHRRVDPTDFHKLDQIPEGQPAADGSL